jgi:hypothetical protein
VKRALSALFSGSTRRLPFCLLPLTDLVGGLEAIRPSAARRKIVSRLATAPPTGARVSRFRRRPGVRPQSGLVQRGDGSEKYEAGEESCGCRDQRGVGPGVMTPGDLLRVTLPAAPFC